MAHKITPVLKPKGGQSSSIVVSQEVKDEFDEFYAYLTEHPDQEGLVEFDSADEIPSWKRQMLAYGQTREAGAVKFRQLPSKHLEANILRFQLTADLPENGKREGAKK